MTEVTNHLANGMWLEPASSTEQHRNVGSAPERRAPAANDTGFEHEDDQHDDGAEKEPAGITLSRRTDAKNRLRRIVGPRLHKARKLSGLSQSEAAERLGYSTPAQLSLWEMSRRMAPLAELIKAATLYGVSVGFIVGESNEPERDPSMALRHACLNGVRRQLDRVAEITVAEIARQVRLVGPHAGNVRSLLSFGDDLVDAVEGLIRNNSDAFAEMRGGATLQRRSEDFARELQAARAAIRLHDALDGDLRCALAAINDNDLAPLAAE